MPSPIRFATLAAILVFSFSGQASPLKAVKVTFKFDPGPTYGGPRWLDPPYRSGLQGGQAKVEARVEGVDTAGRPAKVAPRWTAGDPAMVVVSPVVAGKPEHVRITVKRAGESKLEVTADGVSRVLRVKATQAIKNAMRVEIFSDD
jgi:hypothetical protein